MLRCIRRVLIKLETSNHSRVMVSVIYKGKRQLPIWEKTRVKISAIAPRVLACVQLICPKFSLIWLRAQFHASMRAWIPMSSAYGGWGRMEYSRATVQTARVCSASAESALISRPLGNTAAWVAFVTQGQISSPRGLYCNRVTGCDINLEGSFDSNIRAFGRKVGAPPLPTRIDWQKLHTARRYP